MRSLRRFPVLYGLGWALFVAAVATLFVSVAAHFITLGDHQLVVAAYAIHCAAVLIGALAASRAARERGWYYGGLTGLIYAVIMVCLGLVIDNTFSLDAAGLFRVLLMAVIGAFGGIVGVGTAGER
ncbi:MAG: TIGR04086 family membrane protein [Alicyclobacillaceae bacterium]|nr:TIGR04086 family membrane protein [Alicyclobacillaceae bacterium]